MTKAHPAVVSAVGKMRSLIQELETERAHSVGCEHSVDPPHRCYEVTCFRQWQADRIRELEMADRNLRAQILATMARHGLHQGQRMPYYDDHDNRVDPLDDKPAVRSFLVDLETLVGLHES